MAGITRGKGKEAVLERVSPSVRLAELLTVERDLVSFWMREASYNERRKSSGMNWAKLGEPAAEAGREFHVAGDNTGKGKEAVFQRVSPSGGLAELLTAERSGSWSRLSRRLMSTWWLTIFHSMVRWFFVRLNWGTGVGKGSTCPIVDVQHRRYTSHFVEPVCDVLCRRRREEG